MFTNNQQNNYSPQTSYFNFPPRNFTENTKEITRALDLATSTFTIVKSNCDKACNTGLEINNSSTLDPKTQYKFDSCVRRCFVQRIKQHFPENLEVTDFLYASAFEYKQADIFGLIIKNIANDTSSIQTTNFKGGLNSISNTFNSYFA